MRSPGRTPTAASPAASSVTRRDSAAQLTVPSAADSTGAGSSARASSADHSVPASRVPGRSSCGELLGDVGRAYRSVQVVEPGRDGGGVLRGVLGDQVRGALEAVDLRVREPLAQVGEVALAEDRVARSPEHQCRDVEGAHALGQLRHHVVRRVPTGERDVGHEVPHTPGVARGRRTAAPGRRAPRGAAPAARAPSSRGRRSGSRRSRRGVRRAGRPAGSAAGRGRPGAGRRRCCRARRRAAGRGAARAQPSEMMPPQSWPTVTTGPSMPRASVSAPRSATRCATSRGASVRSENPIPRWSGATTRHPAGAAASRPRHR